MKTTQGVFDMDTGRVISKCPYCKYINRIIAPVSATELLYGEIPAIDIDCNRDSCRQMYAITEIIRE